MDFSVLGLTSELKRRKCVQQTPIKTSTSVSSSSVDTDDLLPDIGSSLSDDEQAARDNSKPSEHEHSEQEGDNWGFGVCRVTGFNDEGIPKCIAYDSKKTNCEQTVSGMRCVLGLDASQQTLMAIKFGVGAAQASSSNAEKLSLLVDDWEVLEVQQQKNEYSDDASSHGSHSSTRSSHTDGNQFSTLPKTITNKTCSKTSRLDLQLPPLCLHLDRQHQHQALLPR